MALAVYAHPDDPDVSCGGTLAALGRRRLRGAHPDLHRRREGHRRPRGRAEGAGAGPCRGVRRRRGRPGRSPARTSSVCPTGSSRTRPGSARRSWPRSGGCAPRSSCAPTRPRCSSGRTTSTTGTTGSPGSPCSTPWRPAAAMPHYFPEAGPAHQVSTVLLSGTLEPDVWVDITDTVDAKGAAVACHRSQFPDGGEWAGHRHAPGRRGRRSQRRRPVRRGLPETAPRGVSVPTVTPSADAPAPGPRRAIG